MTTSLPRLLLLGAVFFSVGCASTSRQQPTDPPVAVGGGAEGGALPVPEDDLDLYAVQQVGDPLQPVNRVTFQINHTIYRYALDPVSRVYKTVLPKPVRQGIYNFFENVRVPIRLVNNVLQGNFPRAGQEAGRFLVNSTIGVAGIGRPSNHMPLLADVPPADTGQTFAKWGIGNGPYIVLPLLGPSTARDTVGLAGDYALNPLTWVSIVYGSLDWIIAIPTAATLRSVPKQIDLYNAVTEEAMDPYLAARSAYIQSREELLEKAREPVRIEKTPKTGRVTVTPEDPEPKP